MRQPTNVRHSVWVLSALWLLLSVSCGGQQPSSVQQSAAADARLLFEGGTEYDFGTYSRRDTLRHTFVFHNIGTDTFRLQSVEPSCRCTRVRYESRPVPPDGVDSLELAYDGDGFLEGFWHKTCRLQSNGPTAYTLHIKGNYRAEVE